MGATIRPTSDHLMSLRDLFRRAPDRPSDVGTPGPGEEQRTGDVPTSTDHERLAAWLAASEAGRLHPPRDVRDRCAWDTYWRTQIEVGPIDQGFADVMSSDAALPGLLTKRGSQTILCAGNGLSDEALSLALLGFQVTALDISAVPAEVIGRMLRSLEHPVHRIPGFRLVDDNTVAVDGDGPIDAELCPAIHRSADRAPRCGGSLTFVTGDVMDPDVCPGPFDVVIERRTLQLFPRSEQASALDYLVERLAERGVFVSHQHQGGWKPGQPRTHYAEGWLRSHGFVFRFEAEGDQDGSIPRLASLKFSTG
jgi:hypothetical protein